MAKPSTKIEAKYLMDLNEIGYLAMKANHSGRSARRFLKRQISKARRRFNKLEAQSD